MVAVRSRMVLWCPAKPPRAAQRAEVAATVRYAAEAGAHIVYCPVGDPDGRLARELVAGAPASISIDATAPATQVRSLATTLARLADLPVERLIVRADERLGHDLAGELAEAVSLVSAGQVDGVAVSPVSPRALRFARGLCPVASVALPLSLLERAAERELVPAARAMGAGLLLQRPLAGGLLTGAGLSHQQPRSRLPSTVRRQLVELAAAAAARDISSTRLALAWLLARFPDADIGLCTSRVAHFEMDLAARRVQLDDRELIRLETMFGG